MAEGAAGGMTTDNAPPAVQDDGVARHLINGLDLPDIVLASTRGDAEKSKCQLYTYLDKKGPPMKEGIKKQTVWKVY